MAGNAASWGLGLLGAVMGGVLGFFAFGWIAQQGFYALVMPGAFLGLGCGLLSRHDSPARGALCGLAGLALGIVAEWSQFPFVRDRSFGFFLTHLHELQPVTLIMVILGGVLAFWFGRGQYRGRREAPPDKPDA